MHSFNIEILLITLLSLVLLSDVISKKIKIPSVFLLLLGSYVAYAELNAYFPHEIKEHFDTIVIFCIPLIFLSDSLHLSLDDIKIHAFSIFYLAVVAVALCITVGASLSYFGIFAELSLGAYVALFSINMATDAVSVQSILSRFDSIKHDIKVLIEGESLGNDATAVIAFFFIGLEWMMSSHIDPMRSTMESLRVFATSIIAGVVLGSIFYMFMKLFSNKRSEFFAFVIEAYGAYLLGEYMHSSGILTLIVAIVTTKGYIDADMKEYEQKRTRRFMARLRMPSVKATTRQRLEYIYEMSREFSYIASAMIFFVLVEMVDLELLWRYKVEILIMFFSTTIIRALSMAKFAFFGKSIKGIKPVGVEGWFILTFSGMKGALSIILVHMIPDSFAHKEMFEAITVGVVLLSIFVYGTILWSYFTFFSNKQTKIQS